MIEQAKYYSAHSPMTYLPDEPGITMLLEGLPETVQEIVETVQNSLIHIFWAERYGLSLTPERRNEVNIRSTADMFRKIYEIRQSPLTDKRELSEKLVGNCRDFTVLTVSLMRQNGIPARARSGFGAYFSGPEDKIQYVDHWVVEYWNGTRWVLVDAQIDDFQRQVLGLDFDTLDMPQGKVITSGAAWAMCKEGADPDSFGIGDVYGWWFIKGDMVRDLASLVKIPLLCWDVWGTILTRDLNEPELMDRVARITGLGTENYQEIIELNEHPLLKVPEKFYSWLGGPEPTEIRMSYVTEELR